MAVSLQTQQLNFLTILALTAEVRFGLLLRSSFIGHACATASGTTFVLIFFFFYLRPENRICSCTRDGIAGCNCGVTLAIAIAVVAARKLELLQ